MAQYCNKCRLKEMVIINSPVWASADIFEPCKLSMKAICRVCDNTYNISQTFNSLREYETFLDKYNDND